jgi:hypothetical protein
MDGMVPFFPNNPTLIPNCDLGDYERQGCWMEQPKFDGWRRPGYLEKASGEWTFKAKYQRGEQAAKQPPALLVSELSSLGFPDGTAFDMEWMGPRVVNVLRGRHFFVLLDLLYWNGKWQGDIVCEERYETLKTLAILHKSRLKIPTPNILVVDSFNSGFVDLFEEQKKNPLTEGVVLKNRFSKLIMNPSRTVDNPQWKKAKYRD